MNTQTHILIAATMFAKPGKQNRAINAAAILGGLLPDLTIFIMFFWSKITLTPEAEVWEKWYYSPFWQFWIDAFNSLPIFLVGLAIGLLLFKTTNKLKTYGTALAIFSAAAIVHLIGDIFLHVNDAHAHFWPFSHWRFVSSVSYWNPQYYGLYSSAIEFVAGIIMSLILFRRFQGYKTRALLVLAILSYIIVPAYFFIKFGL